MYEAHELNKQNISDFLPTFTQFMNDEELSLFYITVSKILHGQDFDEDTLYDIVSSHADEIRTRMNFYSTFQDDPTDFLDEIYFFSKISTSEMEQFTQVGMTEEDLLNYFYCLCDANDIVGWNQPYYFCDNYVLHTHTNEIVNAIHDWWNS